MTNLRAVIAHTIRLATSTGTTDVDTLADRIADAITEQADPLRALRAEFAEAPTATARRPTTSCSCSTTG